MREELRISGRGAVPVWHRVPAFSLSRGWGEGQEEGEKRKQEKGNVPWTSLSVCLHIVFSRDMARGARDTLLRNGGNPPSEARNREIRRLVGRAR
jgi:hypothetical protein